MQALSNSYPVWFCDIWGVVHNGVAPFVATTDVLQMHRENGGRVVLVTNAPRTAADVEKQLAEIGVNRACWDDVVTSGDVTRDLMVRHSGGKLYHIGPGRDLSLFEGLDVKRVAVEDAGAIICTGLFREESEQPEAYSDFFIAQIACGLPMICANPDKIVRKGDKLLPCAGALAEIYSKLGGRVLMAGKPYAPIYDLAVSKCGGVDKTHILAIGDGPETDVKGAADYGLPVVLIAGGVNESGDDLETEVKRLVPQARILKTLFDLTWI